MAARVAWGPLGVQEMRPCDNILSVRKGGEINKSLAFGNLPEFVLYFFVPLRRHLQLRAGLGLGSRCRVRWFSTEVLLPPRIFAQNSIVIAHTRNR